MTIDLRISDNLEWLSRGDLVIKGQIWLGISAFARTRSSLGTFTMRSCGGTAG